MAILHLAERAIRRALNAGGLESRWVQTSIANHHLYDAPGRGALPTIVVLHGISSAATPFAPLIQRLRPHVRRVIAPEAPGHGFSGEPTTPLTPESLRATMLELLDRELRDEPAIVFGNSLGGGVALNYAIDRPDRVRGLFLASPAGAEMSGEELERFLGTFDLRTRGDAKAFLDRLYHRSPWFAPLVASDVQRLFARDVIRSFTSSVSPDHLFKPEQLASLAMPVHLVWGRSERLMPAKNLAYFRAHLPPGATIEEPLGFGHCAHLDDPARLAEKIVAFARRVAG